MKKRRKMRIFAKLRRVSAPYEPQPSQPPQYQAPIAPVKKRSALKWILGILGALVILCGGGFVACTALVGKGVNDAVKKSDAKDQAAATENQKTCVGKSYPDQQPTNDRCADGTGAVALNGINVTATPLKRRGKDLCTNVAYVNNSKETISFNVFDWKLQIPAGEVKDAFDSSLGGGEDLGSGDLVKGGTKKGMVCYEVSGSGQFVLIYKPSFWSDARGIWVNSLKG